MMTNYKCVCIFQGITKILYCGTNDIFWISLFHSVVLTTVVVFFQFGFGLILALAMSQKLPGMSIFKSIIREYYQDVNIQLCICKAGQILNPNIEILNKSKFENSNVINYETYIVSHYVTKSFVKKST